MSPANVGVISQVCHRCHLTRTALDGPSQQTLSRAHLTTRSPVARGVGRVPDHPGEVSLTYAGLKVLR